MKKTLLLIFTVTFFSCNSHLDKSVFEPLTVNELKKTIDKDSLFKGTYEYIVYIRDTVLKSDIDKAKFADLTYKQVYDFEKFSSDTIYFKPINDRVEKEWNEKYGGYEVKVDSISNYWKKYKEENALEQYVNIELARIDKEYYSYSGGIKDVNLGFRLTPLKGKIDQLRFTYRIEAKINKKEDNDLYTSLNLTLDKSRCLSTSPFSKPVIRYWKASYSDEKILKNKTLETFNRDYNIYVEIDQIRIDGKNKSNDDLKVPESVEDYWKYQSGEYLYIFDDGTDEIVKEILGETYINKYGYRNQEIDKILKEKDPLAFEFLRLPLTTKKNQ
ncbi:hypothetical protein [Zobellia uliginosa]|uniref:hypothetical protein n=1 Tax=Zobellia uliginosa TaxID=143224 RepID=UPI0026E2DA69|nr:hypothetical protein [Zobellia uliginosa]MDO6518593.1 hypothetical protein [Zobellia uliginosa]